MRLPSHTPKHGGRDRNSRFGVASLARRPVVGGLLAVGMLGSIGAGAVEMGQETSVGAQQSTGATPSSGATSGSGATNGAEQDDARASRGERREPSEEPTTRAGPDAADTPVSERDYSSEELDIIRKDPKAWGRELAFEAGWSDRQWMCLHDLWVGESAWQWNARNDSSGAYGIPQALPASKMASAGKDWRTNPITQMEWGIEYIEKSYGGPCQALEFWYMQDPHWY